MPFCRYCNTERTFDHLHSLNDWVDGHMPFDMHREICSNGPALPHEANQPRVQQNPRPLPPIPEMSTTIHKRGKRGTKSKKDLPVCTRCQNGRHAPENCNHVAVQTEHQVQEEPTYGEWAFEYAHWRIRETRRAIEARAAAVVPESSIDHHAAPASFAPVSQSSVNLPAAANYFDPVHDSAINHPAHTSFGSLPAEYPWENHAGAAYTGHPNQPVPQNTRPAVSYTAATVPSYSGPTLPPYPNHQEYTGTQPAPHYQFAHWDGDAYVNPYAGSHEYPWAQPADNYNGGHWTGSAIASPYTGYEQYPCTGPQLADRPAFAEQFDLVDQCLRVRHRGA
ncbi:hypothetical protein BJX61DRAFT_545454 [Aspergillus egyptiacus]|nr:hypothetical protein BJX61DRAFT_545454 [Aspergillus egyptiacus]